MKVILGYRGHLNLPSKRNRWLDFERGPNWFMLRAFRLAIIHSWGQMDPARQRGK